MTQRPTAGAVDRAETLCDLRRFDEAVRVAGQALATDPHNARIWCVMARAKLGGSDAAGALDAAGRAVALAPENEWPHRLASVALSLLDRDQDALAAAIEAARLEPFVWQTHVRVAYASVGCHFLPQAKAAARHAVELAPNEPDAWQAVGAVAAVAREWDDAEAAYRRALELDPNDSASHDGLARLQLMRGRGRPSGLANAMTGFATAVRLDPYSKESRQSLELAIRSFLSILFICVWVDVVWVARFTVNSGGVAARALPLVLLAVPVGVAVRFVSRLTPVVRAHLWRVLSRGWAAVTTAGFLLCVALLVASTFVPVRMRAGFTLGAAGAVLLARLAIWRDLHQFRRNPASVSPATWAIRSALWWALAVVASLLAIFGFIGLFSDGGAAAVEVFATGAVIAVSAFWWIRRRASRRQIFTR